MLEHMEPAKPKRPRDPAQLAKAIVDEATGQTPPAKAKPALTERHAIAGRMGGEKGGKARAERLTPAQRQEIAKKAASVRWGNALERSGQS